MYFSLCQNCTIQHIIVLFVSPSESSLSQKCRIIVSKHCFRKHGMHRKHGMLLWDFYPVSWPCLFAAFWVGYISKTTQPVLVFSWRHVDSTHCLNRSALGLKSGRVSSPDLRLLRFHCDMKVLEKSKQQYPIFP